MKARFIKQIGVRGDLRIYWDLVRCTAIEPCTSPGCGCGGYMHKEHLNKCPNSYGKGKPGTHNAYASLGEKLGEGLERIRGSLFGEVGDYPAEQWPTHCRDCGAAVSVPDTTPEAVGSEVWITNSMVSVSRLYDTPSGDPEPGDVFATLWHQPGECLYWDNCDGTHIYGVLPNGQHWDVMSRASNCTMREDRTHRCWVATGSAEAGTLDVGKAGHTCQAGAGSIQVEGWHGFLRNFTWVG